MDEQVYKSTAVSFPGEDKYYNFEGLLGINFKNYSVMGTPTMFLLNLKGFIIEKIATIEQLLACMKKRSKYELSALACIFRVCVYLASRHYLADK